MDVMLQRILELIGDKHGATKQVAEAIEVSPNTISNWKSGTNKSYTKKADKIADYYGVSVDWLCGRSDDREIKKAPTEGECNKQEALREALKDYISDTMGKVDDETVDRVLDFTAIYLALLGGQKDEQ